MGKTQRLWACVAMVFLSGTLSTASGASRGLQIVDHEGKSVGLYKGSYALVIGVSKYTQGWPSLPGVANDTEKIKTALQEQGFDVTLVQDPTKAALYEAMDSFRKEYGLDADNRLLFYYAGHGHTLNTIAGDMGYLVPADAPNPNEDRKGFLGTAMDMEYIEAYAKNLQSKHALFLFDSCFSGSLLISLSREAPPKHITEKTSQPVRQFITAGNEKETVPDQSIFAQQFLAALQGEADVNRDGYLTGTELGEFLKDQVINYSGSMQHPQVGKIRNPNLDKGDFVFQVTITVQTAASGMPIDTASQPQRKGSAPDPEAEMWGLVKDSKHRDDVETFLQKYPSGKYESAARLKLQQLERQATPHPPSVLPSPTQPLRQESFMSPVAALPSSSQSALEQIREAERLWKGGPDDMSTETITLDIRLENRASLPPEQETREERLIQQLDKIAREKPAPVQPDDGWTSKPLLLAFLRDSFGPTTPADKALLNSLEQAMRDTGRFTLVEQELLEKILTELKLHTTALVDSQTAVQVGEFVGASLIAKGSIVSQDTSDQTKKLSIALISTRRRLNIASAEVYFDPKVSPETTLTELAKHLLNRLRAYKSIYLPSYLLQGEIVRTTPSILLNIGAGQGVTSGMVMEILEPVEINGKTEYFPREDVGRITVTDVQVNSSRAKSLQPDINLQPGWKVREVYEP